MHFFRTPVLKVQPALDESHRSGPIDKLDHALLGQIGLRRQGGEAHARWIEMVEERELRFREHGKATRLHNLKLVTNAAIGRAEKQRSQVARSPIRLLD